MKLGTVRSDGFTFHKYCRRSNGKINEEWLAPDAYHRSRISRAFHHARKRANDKDLPFDIDIDYLVSIFPSDGLCPALRIPIVWGSADGRTNSPSLDRKVPALGYVRGNVAFISNKANQIKSDATADEVQRVANYLKG